MSEGNKWLLKRIGLLLLDTMVLLGWATDQPNSWTALGGAVLSGFLVIGILMMIRAPSSDLSRFDQPFYPRKNYPVPYFYTITGCAFVGCLIASLARILGILELYPNVLILACTGGATFGAYLYNRKALRT